MFSRASVTGWQTFHVHHLLCADVIHTAQTSYNERTMVHGEITMVHGEITMVHGEITMVHGEITMVHGERTMVHGEITMVHGEITTVHGEITTVHGERTTQMEKGEIPFSIFLDLSTNLFIIRPLSMEYVHFVRC